MKLLPEKKQETKDTERMPYEAPAVMYEGAISTRAGSPLISPDGSDRSADPADLFSN